jgi:hypothetical protein
MGIDYNNIIVTDGLVFFLDAANTRSYSGSGTSSNSLVGGIGATLVNGVGFTSSNNGTFTFDGTNDYIAVSGTNFPLSNSARTLNIWYYTKTSTWQADVNNLFWYGTAGSTRQSFGVDFGTYPTMEFYSWADDINWNTTAPQVGWKNLQIAYDGNLTVRIYELGVLVATKTFSAQLNTVLSTDVQIGAITYVPGYFDSNISQVSMYNRALSAQEILQNYNATKRRYGL